ncbi:hypothetical protein GCM10022407_34800 [Hymenobacter antarcticus]|uniref:Uncharacterized protein n=2 Tax=Hymenobacter antarcticus TaxID=486270 RepID=A0ABP7QRN5_9BACT
MRSPATSAQAAAQARTAAAFARLQATLAALDASTARIKAANLAAAAQPPRPARTPSPLALLVWAAQQPQ